MLFLTCIIVALLSLSATIAGQVVDNPSPANFLRRVYHASIVLGDYVYIDGGEFSQLVDGAPDPGQGVADGLGNVPGTRQNNVTLSIDLTTSWTNSSLSMKIIPKGSIPALNFEHLWSSVDGNSCYVWGGERTRMLPNEPPPPVSLWKLSSDHQGGGLWTEESLSTSSPNPPQLFRPTKGCATTIRGTGFYVGGYIDSITDPKAVSLPDLYAWHTTVTSFNTSSAQWSDESPTILNSAGTILGARAVTLPAMGLDGRGLVFILGGWDPGLAINQLHTDYIRFDNITFYDPYIDLWYAQQATGDIPPHREYFCAVSVLGDNGTYEIFVYGGIITPAYSVYDEFYVLSVPGFVWFKSPNPASAPRYYHTCEHVRGSQLMVIGGLDNPKAGKWDIWSNFKVPDPFVQGIGIFDMTSMMWKTSYDADSPPYTSPKIVKEWYSTGGQATVEWQSLEIARMFIRDSPVTVNPTPPPAASPTAEATTQGDDGDNIAIGLGVGLGVGIPGLLAGAVSAWYAWKTYRLKKKKSSAANQNGFTNAISGRETVQTANGSILPTIRAQTHQQRDETPLSAFVQSQDASTAPMGTARATTPPLTVPPPTTPPLTVPPPTVPPPTTPPATQSAVHTNT